MSKPIPVLLFFGPTASGKTSFLEALFTGPEAIGAQIISADSMQVYRGMDTGTAKPSRELLERLPHHLIDIRSPDEQFHVGDFVRLADELCPKLWDSGFLPVLSGGTAWYLKTFREGLPAAPESDPLVREQLAGELAARGPEALHAELLSLDPVSGQRIHPNDHYRIMRALEVCRSTGKALSSFKKGVQDDQSSRPSYRFLSIELSRPREELYRRIDQRCAAMFESGLAKELSSLVRMGYGPHCPGMRAIGYREFFTGEGELCDIDNPQILCEVQSLVARNSRRYAKRQITFFSSLQDVVRIELDADENEAALEQIRSLIKAFLAYPVSIKTGK